MAILKKIIEYGLYLLAFLLPLQTRWIIKAGELNGGYWEYGTYSLYITDILLVSLLFLFLVYILKTKKISNFQFPISNYWFLIAGLELFVFISIFLAPDKLLAFYKYGVFLLGVGLFWLITSASYNKLKLIYGFLAGVFLQAGLGIWQFLTQTSGVSKWLGVAAHYPGDLGVSVVETLSGGRWLRAYGGLDHPNVLGGVLVVGILLIIFLLIEKIQSKNFQFSIFNFQLRNNFLLFTFITALFFTFSRGAWLATLIGALVMLAIFIFTRQTEKQKILLKIIFFSSILIFVLFSQFKDLTATRLAQNTRLEIKSSSERIESWQIAGEIIKAHWFLGTGIGNYTLAVHNELAKKQPSYNYQPAHNVFILVFAEIGITGLLFYVLLPLLLIFPAAAGPRQSGGNFFTCAKASVAKQLPIISAVMVMMMVDHWWWSLHFGVLLFWFLLGVIINTKSDNPDVASG